MKNRYLILSAAIAVALMTSACGGGGGGGNVRDDVPPPPPTDPNPPGDPDPGNDPDPNPGDDGGDDNGGGDDDGGDEDNDPDPNDPDPGTPTDPDPDPGEPDPDPTTPPRFTSGWDNVLVGTNSDLAHEKGYTGSGAKIAMLDDPYYEDYATLDGKVHFYKDYTDNPGEPEPDTNTTRGHGSAIAATIVGKADGENFKGGIAPDAQFYWGRICYDNSCWSDAAGRAVGEMVDEGVTIFNLSIGGYYGDDVEGAEFSSMAWGSAMGRMLDVDGLAIFAAGNDGMDNISYPGGAPVYLPELENNWLVVTSFNLDGEGNITGKSYFANSCGDAADWCLAAPGLTWFPEVLDTPYQGGAMGTSMSTGLVTGVAALVSGAYPWMTGNNIQHTLLTTATDIGEEGVDEVFGWGAVDANKAVEGPGQFHRRFNADVNDGFSYYFTNDINGEDGITKEGHGGLILTGESTYEGDTIINDGWFAFLGDNHNSNVIVNGGSYTSLGGILGGDYTVGVNGTTEIYLGMPMQVIGQANLDGNLSIFGDNNYITTGRELLIDAGSINGEFANSEVAENLFWSAELDYTDSEVYAEMTRNEGAASASAMGATQSIIDGAGLLDSAIEVVDSGLEDGSIDYGDAIVSELGAAMNGHNTSLASLTGQIHGTARTLAVEGAINTTRVLADRMPHLANTDERTAWISATGIDGDMKRDGYANAEYRQNEFTAGVDIPLGDSVIGASITSGEVDADIFASNSKMDSSYTGVSIYGVKPMGDAYISGVIGYQEGDIETRRDVIVGDNVSEMLSKRDDSIFHARVEGGYNLNNGITPFIGVGHITHKQDGFSETGDSALGLSAGSDRMEIGYADMGMRHRFTRNNWSFDSMIAYRNIFSGRNTDFNAWFNGLDDASFSVNGQALSRDAARAMFGATYKASSNVSVYGNVGFESASGNKDNASAQIGVRVSF